MTPSVRALGLLSCLCSTAVTLAQPSSISPNPATSEQPPVQRVATSQRVVPEAILNRFGARLSALRPSDPEAYFVLGEDLIDAFSTVEAKRLATELFVLAAVLDVQRTPADRPASIAASACLALLDIHPTERDRVFLSSLARTLDSRRIPPTWMSKPREPAPEGAPYQVAALLGYIRSGQGAQARQLLAKPEVRAALDSYDRVLRRMGVPTSEALAREASRWPCPECSNERIVRRSRPGAEPEVRVCPVCAGNPGPRLNNGQLLAQLRFEAWLLQGRQRTWSAQSAVDNGAPLIDPEIASLPQAYSVNPGAYLWRDNDWFNPNPPAPPNPVPAPEVDPAPAPAPVSGS